MHGNQWAPPWNKGYWRFSLSTIWAATAGNYARNGVPIPGTPLDMRNGRMRAYYNTICSLGFSSDCGGNGIGFKNFEDHFVLVFDLTSTREASKSLTLFPELTGASLTEVTVWKGLRKNSRTVCHCWKIQSNFYRFAAKHNQKFVTLKIVLSYTHLMDNFSLQKLASQCNHLTEFFRESGVPTTSRQCVMTTKKTGKRCFKLWIQNRATYRENTAFYFVVEKNSLGPLAKKIRELYFGIVWETNQKLTKDCTRE